jgi:conserved oligomeric Golgi complex subunit 2
MTLLSLKSGDSGGKPTLSEQDKARRRSDVKECLRTYDVLRGWREAEAVVRREIVQSFIKQVCCFFVVVISSTNLSPRPFFLERFLYLTRLLFLGRHSLRVH